MGLGTLKKNVTDVRMPHTSNFDFNDEMIATGAYLWVRLVEDRFEV